MPKVISLTQANDEGFDPQALGFDIRNMSNVHVYQVLKVAEIVNDGHLHYVKLEFIEGEIADPKADPMIVGTISRTIEQEPTLGVAVSPTQTDRQWRVLWDNKLWRPLDEGSELLEAFMGIKASDVEKFVDKLAENTTRKSMIEGIVQKHRIEGWKPHR